MLKLDRLRKEALESCNFRRHRMGLFSRGYRFLWFSKCQVCGMEVCVTDRPEQNGIEVSGEAVALYCTGN